MLHLVQENIFKEKNYNLLIETFKKFGIEYQIVKLVPFIHDIVPNVERKDVFLWGSVALAHIGKKYEFTPGSFYNDNHDFEVYSEKYGLENMLNGDGKIINLEEDIPFDYFFARPTKDTKIFSGQCFEKSEYYNYIQKLKSINEKVTSNSRVLVAPLKSTKQEVRCWVVKGKVVTASRYMINGKVIPLNYDHESFYINYAQEMVNKYQPAEAFVIDVCLVDNELKIVEINCFNCSGFYDCNFQKLILEVENSFG